MGDAETCLSTCAGIDEHERDSLYSIDNATNSTALHCRVLHTARAFQDPSACAAAVGGDPCQ
jgi:hypothetical protein